MALQHHVGKWFDSKWLFLVFNHRNDTAKLFLQATPPVPKQAWKMDELAWTVSHTAMKKLLPSAASSAWITLVFFGPQVTNPTSLQNSFTNFNLNYTHPKTNEWQWENQPRMKMHFLLKMVMFNCHVSFRGCSWTNTAEWNLWDRCKSPQNNRHKTHCPSFVFQPNFFITSEDSKMENTWKYQLHPHMLEMHIHIYKYI